LAAGGVLERQEGKRAVARHRSPHFSPHRAEELASMVAMRLQYNETDYNTYNETDYNTYNNTAKVR